MPDVNMVPKTEIVGQAIVDALVAIDYDKLPNGEGTYELASVSRLTPHSSAGPSHLSCLVMDAGRAEDLEHSGFGETVYRHTFDVVVFVLLADNSVTVLNTICAYLGGLISNTLHAGRTLRGEATTLFVRPGRVLPRKEGSYDGIVVPVEVWYSESSTEAFEDDS
jgi:hypothetical protein